MPSGPLTFRAMCGRFVSILIHFMSKHLESQVAIKALKVRACVDGVTVGLLLSLFCFGNLLFLCGDVELNPGPPKSNNSRQTRLTSETGRTKRVDTDIRQPESSSAQSTTSQPTLRDVMDLICSMNDSWSQPYESSKSEEKNQPAAITPSTDIPEIEKSLTDHPKEEDKPSTENLTSLLNDMNRKFDEMKMNLSQLTKMCTNIKDEISNMKQEVKNLKQEQEELRKENSILKDKAENFERKSDYLESQCKKKNVIFHGVYRKKKESNAECENAIQKILTDKLQLTEKIEFEKIHRLNNKDDSPIVASFTHFHQKKTVLRVRHKLQGSNIFICPDLPVRIRDMRRKLLPLLKEAKQMNKKAFLMYDHLVIDGKKHYYDQNGLISRDESTHY